MVILDTSLIVDASRKKKQALDLIASYSGKEHIATTVVTKYEMLRGAAKQDVGFVSDLLKKFVVFDFEEGGADEAVKAFQSLRGKGERVNEVDVIIVGIAAANNETLITRDRDFLNFESGKIIVLTKP